MAPQGEIGHADPSSDSGPMLVGNTSVSDVVVMDHPVVVSEGHTSPSNVEAGNDPLGTFLMQNNPKDRSTHVLRSSESEFGPDILLEADCEQVLSRFEVHPTSETYDLGVFTEIKKPEMENRDKILTFKMTTAKPGSSTHEQAQQLRTPCADRQPSHQGNDTEVVLQGVSFCPVRNEPVADEDLEEHLRVVPNTAPLPLHTDPSTVVEPEQAPKDQLDRQLKDSDLLEQATSSASLATTEATPLSVDLKFREQSDRSGNDVRKLMVGSRRARKRKKKRVVYDLEDIDRPIDLSGASQYANISGLSTTAHQITPIIIEQYQASSEPMPPQTMIRGINPGSSIEERSQVSRTQPHTMLEQTGTTVPQFIQAHRPQDHGHSMEGILSGDPSPNPMDDQREATEKQLQSTKRTLKDMSPKLSNQTPVNFRLAQRSGTRSSTPQFASPRSETGGQSYADTLLRSLSSCGGSTKVMKRPMDNIYGVKLQPSIDIQDFLAMNVKFFEDAEQRIVNDAVEKIHAKDIELQKAMRNNDDLVSQLRDSQSHQANLTERLQSFGTKATTLKKFMNGLATDMKSLGSTIRGDINAVIVENESLKEVCQMQTQVDHSLSSFREKVSLTIDSFKKDKEQLESKLSDMAGQLSEEKGRSAILQRQLDKPREEYAKLQTSLLELNGTIMTKLEAVWGIVSTHEGENELCRLVKKCSEDTENFKSEGQIAAGHLQHLKSLLEVFISDSQKHFRHAETVTLEQPDIILGFEQRITGLVETIKSDTRSRGDLITINATLQGTIRKLENDLEDSKSTISKLESQTSVLTSTELSLNDHVNQLEAANASLQSDHTSLARTNDQLEDLRTRNTELSLKLERMHESQANHSSKADVLYSQSETLRLERDELLGVICEKEGQLKETRNIISDFELEKERLKEKALHDLHEYQQTLTKQALSNQSRYVGEIKQAEKEKKIVKEELGTALSELELLKDKYQSLQRQVEETSSSDTVRSLTADIEMKVQQIHQAYTDINIEREKNKDLQQKIDENHASSCNTKAVVKKQNDELVRLREQLREARETAIKPQFVPVLQAQQVEMYKCEIPRLHGIVENGSINNNLNVARSKGQATFTDEQAQKPSHDNVQDQPIQMDERQQSHSPKLFGQLSLLAIDQFSKEEKPANTPARKQRSKINRCRSFITQASSTANHALDTPGHNHGSGSGHHDDMAELLDDEQPTAPSSEASGTDYGALDDVVLDLDGIIASPAITTEADQPDAFAFVASSHETAVRSSSLSSSRSLSVSYEQIVHEDMRGIARSPGKTFRKAVYNGLQNVNLAAQTGLSESSHETHIDLHLKQNEDKPPPVGRHNTMSRGMKRDPVQQKHGHAGRHARPMPSIITSSNKPVANSTTASGQSHASPVSLTPGSQQSNTKATYTRKQGWANKVAQGQRDIFELQSSPMKRSARQAEPQQTGGNVEKSWKKLRLNSGVAATARGNSMQHATRQPPSQHATRKRSMRNPSTGGGSARQTSRSTRKTTKYDERFQDD